MARQAILDDDALIHRLSKGFRDLGFEGASIAKLTKLAGLRKASLYHRFPGGKVQMADRVLKAAYDWLEENVLDVLRSDAPPQERLCAMTAALDTLYEGGERACIINMLSGPLAQDTPFVEPIRATLLAWADALAGCIADAGLPKVVARRRAMRAIAMIQGSLVLARGLKSTQLFSDELARLPADLLRPASSASA